jgi:hypothetical protein
MEMIPLQEVEETFQAYKKKKKQKQKKEEEKSKEEPDHP